MDLDSNALQNASEALFDRLGPLDDLRPDLANTLADIYYKFHVMALEPGIPVAVFEAADPAKLVSERFRISHFYRTVDQLIESIRGHAGEQRRLGEELALDILKYRIDNAEKKNGVRLAIERKFKAVNEISGIYGALKASRETRRFRAQPKKAPEGTGDRSRNFRVTKVSESVAGRPMLHIEPAPLSTDGIPELSDELAELVKPYLKATDNIALRFIDDGLPTTTTAACALYGMPHRDVTIQYEAHIMLFDTGTRKVGFNMSVRPVRRDIVLNGTALSQNIVGARVYQFREVYETNEESQRDLGRLMRIAHEHFLKEDADRR